MLKLQPTLCTMLHSGQASAPAIRLVNLLSNRATLLTKHLVLVTQALRKCNLAIFQGRIATIQHQIAFLKTIIPILLA